MKKITIILGHPDKTSFCAGLAEKYYQGAKDSGAEVRFIKLGELKFDPILHKGYKEIQELEPDLIKAQKDIKWADHLVWIYPNWWGTMPALMKGFIDRSLLPGFGFKYRKDSWKWDKLLAGKSARLIVTKDSPELFYKLFFREPGYKQMKRAILGFCGIKPIKITGVSPVKDFDESKRKKWLAKIYKLAQYETSN